MIKNKNPNPLEFFNLRKADYLPPHFEVVTTPTMYNLEESISKWIRDNLKERYYVGKGINISETNMVNNIESVLKIGFEDPKEASYFMLACPHLKYK